MLANLEGQGQVGSGVPGVMNQLELSDVELARVPFRPVEKERDDLLQHADIGGNTF